MTEKGIFVQILVKKIMTTYSVIIPTWNEEETIGDCINSIRTANQETEILLSDGGSWDKTIRIAKELNCKVISSPKGRGIQSNVGASCASGSILLFLHGDTLLPPDAFEIIDKQFEDQSVQIGTFRISFDHNHWLLNFYAWFTQFDFIFSRFGDQCIIVRRRFFDNLGGFPKWKLFEDVDFLRKARRVTKIHSLPAKVKTSARRFLKNGILRQQIQNGWLILLYFLGFGGNRLYLKYEKIEALQQGTSLIVFARYPRQGKVKTRLASTIGNLLAAEFYRICCEHIFAICRKLKPEMTINLFYADSEDAESIRNWQGSDFYLLPQIGDDLGERIKNAFQTIFDRGTEKAIIIGTDVPELSGEIIKQAENALDIHDLVIGPCPDGGYYLLGMKSVNKELFNGVTWSTDRVFEETMKKAKVNKLSVYELPIFADIDTEDELLQWADTNKTHKNQAMIQFVKKLRSPVAEG